METETFIRRFGKIIGMTALFNMLLLPSITTASDDKDKKSYPVSIEMFAPEKGHRVGIGGRGWFVDLEIEFNVPLAQSGFTVNAAGAPGFQLTGPGVHNNVPPMPGVFSPGKDERIPGLIVLLSTTTIGAKSCQNIANLFNMTGVTDLRDDETELWDTWIVGAPLFGVNTKSTIYVAVAADANNDGIFNDAPDVVTDINQDGKCNTEDLKAVGLASRIERARFFINGDIDLTNVPVVP